MKQIFTHPVYRFVILFSLLFIAWYLFYDLWLHPEGIMDEKIIDTTILFSSSILEWIGYDIYTHGTRQIGIEGTSGLFIGDNCNAITLMALFSGFIIAFPGKIKNKIWFIPSGCLVLFFANVMRICALAIIEVYSYTWMQFNHTYTFTIIIYGLIFLLWMLWVKKFSGFQLPVRINEETK